MIGLSSLRAYFEAPPGSTPTERHNFHYAFRESALIGVINSGGVFLPVFLVRLGSSNLQVSLLTALPAFTGVLLAIPIGAFMQSRRNIVPWYSRGRVGSQAAFGAAALASLLLPSGLVVPGILLLWGIASVFSTITNVAFNVVMNATAGTRGRYELMSRRWSIMGFATAASLAGIGYVLGQLPFPLNFQIVFFAFSLTGLWAYRYGSKIVVPDHVAAVHAAGRRSLAKRVSEVVTLVRAHPAFLSFEARRVVYAMGTTLTLPLIPLYYVRVLHASNSWIGLIGTTQALTLLIGYAIWRQQSRGRGARFVLAASTFGAALHPVALSLTHDVATAALLAGVAAIFTSGVNLAIFDRLMTTVPEGYGVTFNSIDNTIVNVAGIAAPMLGALLADRIGLGGALVVASLVGLSGALLFAIDRSGSAAPESAAAAPAGGG
ncbi:MAG: hypothetical protein O3B31_08485 [Chloroflexi bacterium]|nr:hypothetical protein [Chloroflexota bacterium]MDA1003366.1 hypothetical protein [Chloroflexota bacterium]